MRSSVEKNAAPVAEDLADHALEAIHPVEPGAGQGQPVATEASQVDLVLLGIGVTQAGAVEVAQVPVELDQTLLGLCRGDPDQRTDVRRGRTALELFVAGEEKQSIAQNRPAQGHATGALLLEGHEAHPTIVDLAAPFTVAEDMVDAAGELVGAGFGHRVDPGPGVAALGHVVLRDSDGDLLDRFHRYRLAQ